MLLKYFSTLNIQIVALLKERPLGSVGVILALAAGVALRTALDDSAAHAVLAHLNAGTAAQAASDHMAGLGDTETAADLLLAQSGIR